MRIIENTIDTLYNYIEHNNEIMLKATAFYYILLYLEHISKSGHKSKIRKTSQYERHHIIPRSWGGDDTSDNLVYLTVKNHVKAHYLLSKTNDFKMISAYHFMIHAHYDQANHHNRIALAAKSREAFNKRIGSKISKAIINLNTGEEYKSAKDAMKKLNCTEKQIRSAVYKCNRINYHFFAYKELIKNNKDIVKLREEKEKQYKSKPHHIAVINLNDKKTFKTVNDACRYYGIKSKSSILAAISSKRQAYGYFWARKEDIDNYISLEDALNYYKSFYKNNKIFKVKKVIELSSSKVYDSVPDAERKLSIKGLRSCIENHIPCSNYCFIYYNDKLDIEYEFKLFKNRLKTRQMSKSRFKLSRPIIDIITFKIFSTKTAAINYFSLSNYKELNKMLKNKSKLMFIDEAEKVFPGIIDKALNYT